MPHDDTTKQRGDWIEWYLDRHPDTHFVKLKARLKRPIGNEWQLPENRWDPDELAAELNARPFNLGVVLGLSDLTVVDLDVDTEQVDDQALDIWTMLMSINGVEVSMGRSNDPNELRSAFWFRGARPIDDGVNVINMTLKGGGNLEVRSGRAYCVVPPSKLDPDHPENEGHPGGYYAWVTDRSDMVAANKPVNWPPEARWTDAIIDTLESLGAEHKGVWRDVAAGDTGNWLGEGRPQPPRYEDETDEAFLDRIAPGWDSLTVGERHHALLDIAHSVARLDGLVAVERLVHKVNDSLPTPQDAHDVERIISDVRAHQRKRGAEDVRDRATPNTGTYAEMLATQQAEADSDGEPPALPRPRHWAPPPGLVDVARTLRPGDELPARPPELIEGLVRHRETVGLGAARGVGKSWALLGLCKALGQGGDWFGHQARTKARTVMVHFEMEPHDVAERWSILGGAPASHVDYFPAGAATLSTQRSLLTSAGLMRTTEAHIRQDFVDDLVGAIDSIDTGGPLVIIVDPWSALLAGEENSNSEARELYARVLQLIRWLDATLFVQVNIGQRREYSDDPSDLWRGASIVADRFHTRLTMVPWYRRGTGSPKNWGPREVDAEQLPHLRAHQELHMLRRSGLWLPPRRIYFDPAEQRWVDAEGESQYLPNDEEVAVLGVLHQHGGRVDSGRRIADDLGWSERTWRRRRDAMLSAGLIDMGEPDPDQDNRRGIEMTRKGRRAYGVS